MRCYINKINNTCTKILNKTNDQIRMSKSKKSAIPLWVKLVADVYSIRSKIIPDVDFFSCARSLVLFKIIVHICKIVNRDSIFF
jgi:hypothetical protein